MSAFTQSQHIKLQTNKCGGRQAIIESGNEGERYQITGKEKGSTERMIKRFMGQMCTFTKVII